MERYLNVFPLERIFEKYYTESESHYYNGISNIGISRVRYSSENITRIEKLNSNASDQFIDKIKWVTLSYS